MESVEAISDHLEKIKIAQMQGILRIVCSGGGAKGAVYPGSYKALEESGLLTGIQMVAGSSAGAINAALMAVGMSSSVLHAALLETNLKKLVGKGTGSFFLRNKPGVCFITKDGAPLETLIRKQLVTCVKSYLSHLENYADLARDNLDFGNLWLKFQGENPQFTFSDLGVLNRLFPNDFKQLIIPAVKFPHGELQIFNKDLTPSVEIALACRASASIPVIFEPVQIEVDGKKQKFVDGGVYDNLPTDYFDMDLTGEFIRNTIPQQTLVLAFGEGLANKENKLFQALYGPRWDEVIDKSFLTELIKQVIQCSKKRLGEMVGHHHAKEESRVLKMSVRLVLEQPHCQSHMHLSEQIIMIEAINKAIDKLYGKSVSARLFLNSEENLMDEIEQIKKLCELTQKQMRPILCHQGMLELWRKSFLIKGLGQLKIGYQHHEQKEEGYQRIRRDYPLRTVELRVGDIKSLDFDKATKFARIIDTFGYLDTVNFIFNHELHDLHYFNAETFYVDLVMCFEHIYEGVLCSAGKELKSNGLVIQIGALKNKLEKNGQSKAVISRQIYQLIKDHAEVKINSIVSFALSRAVEFHNHVISADELLKETYEEGFKYRGFFPTVTITGARFFRSHSLHMALKDKSIASMYVKQTNSADRTRTSKTLEALQHIPIFYEDFEASLQKLAE